VGKVEDIEPAIAPHHHHAELRQRPGRAQFVLECAVEDMALKQELFAMMDEKSDPDTVLATNNSVMSITEIASTSKGRHASSERIWWNPPYLIPLVESCAPRTSPTGW
jgi:3-hydroxybutyryl-CoA dehydrogenase